MDKLLYKADDVIVVLTGKHSGHHGHVVMSWDDRNWVLELHNEAKEMTILNETEFCLLEDDNEGYERLLPSIDDYR